MDKPESGILLALVISGIIYVQYIYQWLRWGLDPFVYLTALKGAEIIPGKHSDTRIKPLPLTNGHGRYITATPERTLVPAGGWPLHITVMNLYVTFSLPERFRSS